MFNMKAQEIKKTVFQGFINWLNKVGVGDHFSMDVWMSKVFDALYQQYKQDCEVNQQTSNVLQQVPLDVLENTYKQRKLAVQEPAPVVPSSAPLQEAANDGTHK